MKKMLAMVAVATGLMLGSVANAAQVDIFLTQTSATDWSLSVVNNGAIGVNQVQVLVTGLNTMAVNTGNTAIDALSSVLSLDPIGTGQNWAVILGNAGASIGPVGGASTLLATLSGPGPVSLQGSEIPLETYSVAGTDGLAISDYSLTVVPTPVPEPATLLMLGLGLAGLAMVRRAA